MGSSERRCSAAIKSMAVDSTNGLVAESKVALNSNVILLHFNSAKDSAGS